jgi:plasmid stabilization system protein ParE
MNKKRTLKLLDPAQEELDAIAVAHYRLVGPISAMKIIDKIYTSLELLKTHPHLGFPCKDKQLAKVGYRTLICGNYLCVYRILDNTIFVYHIADGRANYPELLAGLPS